MADEYPCETDHAGKLLAAHREAHGVTLAQLARAMGQSRTREAEFIEKNARPPYMDVEAHHDALMDAWVTAARDKPFSLARREQWWATAADMSLWQHAMERAPQVQWWWGTRGKTGERGAWCNVCQTMIHTYDTGRGVTRNARRAIMVHRLAHINQLIAANTRVIEEAQQ